MLLETHELLSKLKKEIPFKTTITLSLDDNDLIIQVLFKKDTVPYYYIDYYTLFYLNNHKDKEEERIIDFLHGLKVFYNNAENEDLEKSELINQIVNWKK